MLKEYLLDLINSIITGIVDSSYIICLTVAMVSIIFYIVGCKKAGKYVSYSIITYILLQALKGCLK